MTAGVRAGHQRLGAMPIALRAASAAALSLVAAVLAFTAVSPAFHCSDAWTADAGLRQATACSMDAAQQGGRMPAPHVIPPASAEAEPTTEEFDPRESTCSPLTPRGVRYGSEAELPGGPHSAKQSPGALVAKAADLVRLCRLLI